MFRELTKSVKVELFRAYCLGAFRNSPWGFTSNNVEHSICFKTDCEIDAAHSLFFRSNFRLQEWMVGAELYKQYLTKKAHFNRCYSEKCGGVAVIVDINGYGELNDFILAGNVPPEIDFYVKIRRILHTSITNFELKVQTEANDFVYKTLSK